jgi:hypothetical protein
MQYPLNPGTVSELSNPIDLSGPKRRYNLEAGCIDEELRPCLRPREQEGSTSTPAQNHPRSLRHSSGPSQDQISQHGNNRITRRTLEEPAPCSLPRPLDEES